MYIPRRDPNFSNVSISPVEKERVALMDIDALLRQNGKSIHDFPSLPIPGMSAPIDVGNNLIMQELSYDINGRHSYGMHWHHRYEHKAKLYLIASSGIAATLLPSGRTAHSRFAIPIQVNETSMCSISQGSPLAKLLECTKLIIWDEAPMVQRYCIEAFDHSLKDLIHSNLPFGGKCIIMGGDFRQILPVVPKGSRASVVNACICSSYLWSSCTIFTLTKNMRLTTLGSEEDKKKLEWFSKWLLDVGDGKLGEPNDGTTDIEVPKALLVNDYEDTIEGIVSVIYGDVIANLSKQ
ncbi:uncharacterized protein LOC114712419 [Neltuma alba]|uniref:uncharacterized protein LOC114712419 n=1 Tax=Neltuma alba TaxID=207710 RepID=UPI0010A343AF|nr:uncharacterized protein LOC114712419 [Prosopis alba]